jgi:hypothetical protein
MVKSMKAKIIGDERTDESIRFLSYIEEAETDLGFKWHWGLNFFFPILQPYTLIYHVTYKGFKLRCEI